MNLEVMWCVVILGVMCIVGATGSSLWLVSFTDPSVPFAIHLKDPLNPSENLSAVYEAFLSFLTYIIILQVMIPLSLYVTIELTKLLQIYHIQNDSLLYDLETNKTIECRAMNIPEDLGQVRIIVPTKLLLVLGHLGHLETWDDATATRRRRRTPKHQKVLNRFLVCFQVYDPLYFNVATRLYLFRKRFL